MTNPTITTFTVSYLSTLDVTDSEVNLVLNQVIEKLELPADTYNIKTPSLSQEKDEKCNFTIIIVYTLELDLSDYWKVERSERLERFSKELLSTFEELLKWKGAIYKKIPSQHANQL